MKDRAERSVANSNISSRRFPVYFKTVPSSSNKNMDILKTNLKAPAFQSETNREIEIVESMEEFSGEIMSAIP